ncbi:hypothetical protein MAR_026247 [Mya arenaria]|uniref:Uncharacterized protein n=1 Tax=Mya arenaria TaxID=6604 RepID=A0ABY7EQ00_MYAAR|nr:hypothetical protein MAR_026247 [Mya arenaria]
METGARTGLQAMRGFHYHKEVVVTGHFL